MAETTTVNYGWTMPDPGASANTWGSTLNATTQKIDVAMSDIQTGMVTVAGVPTQIAGLAPIGGGALWFTATPPAGWLICDGSSLPRAAPYDKLFAAIGTTFGSVDASHFNLPPLANCFPMGAGTSALAATGGEATHVLTAAETPVHAHSITDVAHSHTASQPAHVHPDPGHTHSASAGDTGTHVHGGSLMRFTGSGGTLGVGVSPNNVTTGNTDASNAPGVYVSIGAALTGLQAAQPSVTVNASGTGLTTTNNAGGGAAHNNLPPFLCVNFIIRYQ